MKKAYATTAAANQRKHLFRATTGKTLDEQLQVAAQLQIAGDDVLQKIQQMKKTSKKQKQATKASSLKFEWLHEHNHLKKLEESSSKELESLLLRMYNDASTDKVCPQSISKKNQQTKHSLESEESNDGDNNANSGIQHEEEHIEWASARYAHELEEIIKMEQMNRVALAKQIASDRDQRTAMKQLLVSLTGKSTAYQSNEPQQECMDEMRSNVQSLIFDAVIGRQMIEAALEEEVSKCEQDFQISYNKVLGSLREQKQESLNNSDSACEAQQEQMLMNVLESLDIQEYPDEMLRIEIADEFRTLNQELQNDLAQYERDFYALASASDAAGSVEAAQSKTGGWNDADEERFLKVLKSHERKGGNAKKHELMYDQVLAVLPHMTVHEIKKHVKFHQHRRFYQEKRRDLQQEFERRSQELQVKAKERVQQVIRDEQDRLHKVQQLQALQKQCNKLHDRVAEWKMTKEAKERIERQQQEIDQLLQQQVQQEEELKWKKKQAQQKLLVEDYKKSKVLDEMIQEKLAVEIQQQLEAERAAQSMVNAERVQYRHNEYERKREEERLEEARKIRLEEQRLAKLNALKEETPYAQIIANIVPDANRTRQETIAFRANADAAQEALPVHEAGLFPAHGYDTDTLFRNARFKLGLALRNAGLNSSEHARLALANIKVSNAGAYRHHVAESTQLW